MHTWKSDWHFDIVLGHFDKPCDEVFDQKRCTVVVVVQLSDLICVVCFPHVSELLFVGGNVLDLTEEA